MDGSRIKILLGMEIGLGPGYIVLDGDPAPSPHAKKEHCSLLPHFSANVYSGQTTGFVKVSLGTEVGLRPGYTVSGIELSPLKGVQQPPAHFSAHVYCGQTAVWIQMPLGTEVCLCPAHIVLDGDPAPPTERGTAAPLPRFGPLCSGTVAHVSCC